MGETAQLLFISQILRMNFGRTIFIPAKCPILSFMGHVKGRKEPICCDLSCRNKLVVFNTELLKFFGSLDPRVIPLVITLRHWAKTIGLIKEAALSSYAFTLMIIFFLQNSNPSVLPNVDCLLDFSESSTHVAGWPVSFRQDKWSFRHTTNKDTEEQLLEKFFEFYWNFEFERYAVCVRTGKSLPLEDDVGFQITNISIQDPFNLTHNVGRNLKDPFLLKPSLFIARDILKNNQEHSLHSTVDKFSMLFDNELLNNRIMTEFYCQDSKDSTFILALDHEIISSLHDEDNLIRSFYNGAAKAAFDILHYGFLMDCEIIDMTCYNYKSSENILVSIQCIVYDRVWVNRNVTPILDKFDCDDDEVKSQALKTEQSISQSIIKRERKFDCDDDEPKSQVLKTEQAISKSIIEREHKFDCGDDELKSQVLKTEQAISQSIIERNPHFSSPKPILWFHCNCFKTSHTQMPYFIIQISSDQSYTEFKKVKKFLKLKLPQTIKQMFLENKMEV